MLTFRIGQTIGGEALESRDGIRNPFILFSFLPIAARFTASSARFTGGVTGLVRGIVLIWRAG